MENQNNSPKTISQLLDVSDKLKKFNNLKIQLEVLSTIYPTLINDRTILSTHEFEKINDIWSDVKATLDAELVK